MAEKLNPPAPKTAPTPTHTGPAFDYKGVLQHMIQANASDLHLKVGRPPTLRIDGHMVSLELPALRQEDLRSLAEQIMAPKNIKEFSEQKESDFALAVPGIGRFRVNAYQQRGTIAYALRGVPFQAKTTSRRTRLCSGAGSFSNSTRAPTGVRKSASPSGLSAFASNAARAASACSSANRCFESGGAWVPSSSSTAAMSARASLTASRSASPSPLGLVLSIGPMCEKTSETMKSAALS